MKKVVRIVIATLLLTYAMYTSAPAVDGGGPPQCPIPPCITDGRII